MGLTVHFYSLQAQGTLTNVPGKRLIGSDVTKLHRKIEEMGQRIRQLEDALAIIQASVSPSEQHPLLRDEYLEIKFPLEASEDNKADQASELSDEVGTLTLDEDGHIRYLGRSGGTESLLDTLSDWTDVQDSAEPEPGNPSVPREILQLSNSFPFIGGSWDVQGSLVSITGYLPNKSSAISLCETYFTRGLWSSNIVLREELIEDILTPVYAYIESNPFQKDLPQVEGAKVLPISAHRLAILFFVLAIGSLVDLSLPPGSVQAEGFFELGKACLALNSVFVMPDLGTLQALVLAHLYYHHGSPRYSPEAAWSIVGLMCKTGSYGLHSESTKWKLDAKTLNRRRTIFWEIFTIDTMSSLALGRPPSFNVSFVNCPFPEEQVDCPETDRVKSIRWGWRLAKEVVTEVARSTLTPNIPDYDVILDLDKKLRGDEFSPNSAVDTPYLHTRGRLFSAAILLQLHRAFFVKVILDFSNDPLSSPYALSFLAAYRAASTIIQVDVDTFSRDPVWASRCWGMFGALLSAGVITGSIAIHCPTSSMAHQAFDDLRPPIPSSRDCTTKLSEYSTRRKDRSKHIRKASETSDSRVTLHDDLEMFAGYTKVRMNKGGAGTPTDPSHVLSASASPQPAMIGDKGSVGSGSSPVTTSSKPSHEVSATDGGSSFASPAFATILRYTPVLGYDYQQPYQSVSHNHPPDAGIGHEWAAPPGTAPVPAPADVLTAGDSGMDLQWLTFIQNEGILNIDTHITSLSQLRVFYTLESMPVPKLEEYFHDFLIPRLQSEDPPEPYVSAADLKRAAVLNTTRQPRQMDALKQSPTKSPVGRVDGNFLSEVPQTSLVHDLGNYLLDEDGIPDLYDQRARRQWFASTDHQSDSGATSDSDEEEIQMLEWSEEKEEAIFTKLTANINPKCEPKYKKYYKREDLPLQSIDRYTSGIPTFFVDADEDLDLNFTTTRKFMSQWFGGAEQGVSPPMLEEKWKRMCKEGFREGRLKFLNLDYNPFVPQMPGRPGIFFQNGFAEELKWDEEEAEAEEKKGKQGLNTRIYHLHHPPPLDHLHHPPLLTPHEV
ncbi:hypothetical protein AAF712_004004 [Marasmius tenuissimus]|uniref:Xylanolytic transcriptional activator regulatory domain-containing protein n=1 Tax=Marasmius tenuissimus TaxID=585030 RepID=A0ABR3A549_9AGAR